MKLKTIIFIDPYAPDLAKEDRIERRRHGIFADVFLCSANAITRDGVLVNRDGMGNRVAALAFGPKRVIVVAGINKIVPDIESAMNRIDLRAAPMNCIRLARKTPCVDSLACEDCMSEDRICVTTTITDWQMDPDRMTVVLVGEPLGF